MQKTSIDLRGYKGKGVTVNVKFSNITKPFLVVALNEPTNKILYYRNFDKEKLSFNLPMHNDFVTICVNNGVNIDSVIFHELKPIQLKYNFNNEIIVSRPYTIDQVQRQFLPAFFSSSLGYTRELPTPARFIPSKGLIQYSINQIKDLPDPVIEFIGDHEEGHYYYGRPFLTTTQIAKLNIPIDAKLKLMKHYEKQMLEDEMEADRYAIYKSINKGYNFSGVYNSLVDYLGDGYVSKQRILNAYDEIKKIHKLNDL